jgi:ATP-dependent DNA helicase DinG
MISLTMQEDAAGNKTDPLVEEVHAIFSPTGLLSKAKGFEFRKEQQEMAVEVARALTMGSHVVIEAGTGVGKSLAYLIPSVLFAVREKRKALVCTHTINLQEQLLFKDIPLVQKILPVEFEAALLKGRQNYLCGTRLDRALSTAGDLFDDIQRKELERIREWSFVTKDGTLSDFSESPDPALWAQICSERHACSPKTCAKNPRCFYQAVRRRALAADVLVLNHTLFFTLLGGIDEFDTRESGFLTRGDFAIFDEAHTLEAVASRHLGVGVSQYGLRQTLLRLYNPKTKKGLFQVAHAGKEIPVIGDTLAMADEFFTRLGDQCEFKKGREFRVRQPDMVDGADFLEHLARVEELIKIVARRVDNENLESELAEMGNRIKDSRAGLRAFLRQDLERHVYWVEQTGKRERYHSVNAVPIDLSAMLSQLFFREGTPSVLTSATLSVGSPTLDYFRERVGADGVHACQIGSPFDYEKQMTLYLVKKMPDPRDPAYEESLVHWIGHFTEQSRARAFVLFTSYRTMDAIAERMEDHFADKGWDLLVQSARTPRHKLLEDFRNSSAAVLFGTESFWTGVDVAGEALSNVIITRLPFSTPDHPIIEAKLEAIEEAGGDPFQQYSLPEAILKFRQGFGRLIRSKTDTGCVVILDSRILSKGYGRAFLNALPKCRTEII